MKASIAKTLERDQIVWVRGSVRNVDSTGKWIEVQFPSYSLDIPIKEIRLPRKQNSQK